MSLSSNSKCNKRLGKFSIPRPCKILRTSSSYITNLPNDCLSIIFKCLETKKDSDSFGLTCHQWRHIQNNNQESLWYRYYGYGSPVYQRKSPERFSIVLCKLLIRFQNLKYLSLSKCPRITDYVTSKSQFFGSKVQYLNLDYCSEYSDNKLSLMFSWFPRLKDISLKCTKITDIGLEALVKCCSSLEEVDLSDCRSITDSGVSFILQNCQELRSLDVFTCDKVTGICFLHYPKTLTKVRAGGCNFKMEGISAIVNGGGGGLNSLSLSSSINTEAVMMISRGCPLLKKLSIFRCVEVELEGWKAIGQNCRNLERLTVSRGRLCYLGLQALWNGCPKLLRLSINRSCGGGSAIEIFSSRCRPECCVSVTYLVS